MLEHYLVKEAFEKIEANVVNQLAVAELTPERAAHLRYVLVAMRLFRKYFEGVVADGTIAAMEDQRRSMLDRIMNPR